MHYELSPNPQKVAQMARKIAMAIRSIPSTRFQATVVTRLFKPEVLLYTWAHGMPGRTMPKKAAEMGTKGRFLKKKMEDIIFSMVYTWFTYELYGLDMVYTRWMEEILHQLIRGLSHYL